MRQRLSYPVAAALGLGLLLQAALAFLPDPGLGPEASGLPELRSTSSNAVGIFASNLVTVALLAVGGIVTGWTVVSRSVGHPRRRLVLYLLLLAAAGWTYFVSGVDVLAGSFDISRPALTSRLVHGYLEWPALLLPWAAVAFAVRPHRRLDLRLVTAACACSVALLFAAAIVETYVVPDLLVNA